MQDSTVRDQMLRGITEACQLLISSGDFIASMQASLQVLAKAAQVNRVYIFQNIEENGLIYMHQLYEAVVNATPQQQNRVLSKLPYNEGFERWFQVLSAKKMIGGLVADFPISEKPILEEQDIISILVVPIFIDDYFWGFIGFDDCETERKWSEAEKSILLTMAATYGNAFSRHHTAQKLKESEELFRTLTEYLKSGVYTYDETKKFTYVNPKVIEITGYSKDELLKMNFFDFVHPAFLKQVEERGNSRLQGEDIPASYDFKIQTKTGESRWVKISNCRISIKNRPVILGTATDITKQKIAESELAKEKEQLAVTLRSIGDGVITTDLNGKIALMNQAAEELTGWKQKEALEKPISEVFHLVDEVTNEVVKNPVEIALEKKSLVSLSNHTILIQKNGKRIFIADSAAPIRDENGKMIGIVLVFRDVSKEKKAAKMQETLLKIAVAISTSKDLQELYYLIHLELQTIMEAKNFSIALYNDQMDILYFPYFRDEHKHFVTHAKKKSLEEKVLKKRKLIHLHFSEIAKLIQSEEIDWQGKIPEAWLGVPLCMENKTIGAVIIQDYSNPGAFSKEDEKLLKIIAEQIAIATEKLQMQNTLLESEEKYRLLFEAGNDGILLLENDKCIDCNEKALQLFHKKKEVLLSTKFQDLAACKKIYDSKSVSGLQTKLDLAYDGKPQFFEMELTACSEISFPAEVSFNRFQWKNRYYLLTIIRDISERKKREKNIADSLKEKETLLQEIHHRVKNNMQIISSMLNLQSSLVSDANLLQMLKDSQNRVKTMALVHEKLYRTDDFSHIDFYTYVRDLTSFLFKTYQINLDFINYKLKIFLWILILLFRVD
jgi:PAS domain S-box-containing protein